MRASIRQPGVYNPMSSGYERRAKTARRYRSDVNEVGGRVEAMRGGRSSGERAPAGAPRTGASFSVVSRQRGRPRGRRTGISTQRGRHRSKKVCELQSRSIGRVLPLSSHPLLLYLLPEEGLGRPSDRVFAVCADHPRRLAAASVHHADSGESTSVAGAASSRRWTSLIPS